MVWANNKFYGQKITIAFRLLVDGGLVSASCITGGITDGAMATMARFPWKSPKEGGAEDGEGGGGENS